MRCPICGAQGWRLYLDGCRDRLYGCPGEWKLVECESCRVVYILPFPSQQELPACYPANYHPFVPAKPLGRTLHGKLLRALLTLPYRLRYGSPGLSMAPFRGRRMLDVGCGRGELLSRMAGLGWKCWGIDISPVAVERARQLAPGAKIFQGALEEARWDVEFDLITAVQVLEHLPHPLETLRRIWSLLAPQGKLFVSLPDLDGWEAKLFGRNWIGLDPPRHCVQFRASQLQALLRRCGFTVTSVRPALFASSISESLILSAPERLQPSILHSRAARCLYYAVFPLACLSYALGNHGCVEILAEKRAC